ncbi:MAG TPA: DEAD/DEAH box helicase, partial [Planctomycetes bacterium]|nr:DEAD/DEAH box helicase [Planctomycetota bacterium]
MGRARQILSEVFGFDEFRGEQETIIETLSDGRDAVVLMPTGGGKSLCFQLPALLLDGLTIVISPLIALMQDQVQALQQLGISAVSLNSAMPA